ncbi:MAG: SAM-dependent methyltransferase [Planctomycetes bacterium]|nr:SAM-dependent methyltransferase [Planctomycetota bacterium]
MNYSVEPIGYVHASRTRATDDFWGGAESCIELVEGFTADALKGLTEFSHVEVFFLLHEADPAQTCRGARHPRDNKEWPEVGVFAQRGKNRPNRIGCTICCVLRCVGTRLFVAELDAIDGTPVIDLKPVLAEYLPREPVRQPQWTRELMSNYWRSADASRYHGPS